MISHMARTGGTDSYDGNFPVRRLLKVLGSLGATIVSELDIRHAGGLVVNLWHASNTTLGHYARDWLRLRNWQV